MQARRCLRTSWSSVGRSWWPENTVSSIARLLGVSRSTIYKYVPGLTTGRPAIEQPTARAELETGD
ncbi:helix-turn-helix domain-containing protein [Nonomuraea polychroma]|uniref:helix-turn-helix domain-containing protein n=1 Tax=Nonomuraea polychroma TaxID=46176 RepID=UPI000FDE2877